MSRTRYFHNFLPVAYEQVQENKSNSTATERERESTRRCWAGNCAASPLPRAGAPANSQHWRPTRLQRGTPPARILGTGTDTATDTSTGTGAGAWTGTSAGARAGREHRILPKPYRGSPLRGAVSTAAPRAPPPLRRSGMGTT